MNIVELEKKKVETTLHHHKKEVKKELKSLIKKTTNNVVLVGGALFFSYWLAKSLADDRDKTKKNRLSSEKQSNSIFSFMKEVVAMPLIVILLQIIKDKLLEYIQNNPPKT